MLEYLGCNDVHILDGGWDKWVADGRPTETTVNTLPAAKFKASVKKSKIATKERIKKMLGTKNFAVVDSRTDEEYIWLAALRRGPWRAYNRRCADPLCMVL